MDADHEEKIEKNCAFVFFVTLINSKTDRERSVSGRRNQISLLILTFYFLVTKYLVEFEILRLNTV